MLRESPRAGAGRVIEDLPTAGLIRGLACMRASWWQPWSADVGALKWYVLSRLRLQMRLPHSGLAGARLVLLRGL